MGIMVFGMACVALIAWVVSAEMAEQQQAMRGAEHPTARFWLLVCFGCTVKALGLFGYWLFGVVL